MVSMQYLQKLNKQQNRMIIYLDIIFSTRAGLWYGTDNIVLKCPLSATSFFASLRIKWNWKAVSITLQTLSLSENETTFWHFRFSLYQFLCTFAYLHACKWKAFNRLFVSISMSVLMLVLSHRTDLNQIWRAGSLGLQNLAFLVLSRKLPPCLVTFLVTLLLYCSRVWFLPSPPHFFVKRVLFRVHLEKRIILFNQSLGRILFIIWTCWPSLALNFQSILSVIFVPSLICQWLHLSSASQLHIH